MKQNCLRSGIVCSTISSGQMSGQDFKTVNIYEAFETHVREAMREGDKALVASVLAAEERRKVEDEFKEVRRAFLQADANYVECPNADTLVALKEAHRRLSLVVRSLKMAREKAEKASRMADAAVEEGEKAIAKTKAEAEAEAKVIAKAKAKKLLVDLKINVDNASKHKTDKPLEPHMKYLMGVLMGDLEIQPVKPGVEGIKPGHLSRINRSVRVYLTQKNKR